jgi:hypothetical protein
MAADSNAYIATSKYVSTLGTRNVYIAKLLQNSYTPAGDDWGDGYFNSTDDDATKKLKILDIFKLDALQRFKKTDGTQGFVGIVKRGGINATYHNVSRVSGILNRLGVDDYDVLNDGGLHTTGVAELGNNTNQPKWSNWINVAYIFRSSFYDNSTNIGYSYKINEGSWVSVTSPTTAPAAKIKLEDLFKQIDLTPTAEAGDSVVLKVWITNPEGTMESSELNITTEETLAIPTGADIYESPSGAKTGTTTLYMLSSTEASLGDVTALDTATGLFVFKSEYFTIANPGAGDIADNGWYVIGGVPNLPNGNIKVFQVASGELRKYEERVPDNPTIVFTCINNGQIDFPEYRAQAVIQNDSTPASGFPQTISTGVTIHYMNNADQIITSYYRAFSLTAGDTVAYSAIVTLPPAEATKVQVVCDASAATLGLPKLEPITALPPG